jgi:hypothetical protein
MTLFLHTYASTSIAAGLYIFDFLLQGCYKCVGWEGESVHPMVISGFDLDV